MNTYDEAALDALYEDIAVAALDEKPSPAEVGSAEALRTRMLARVAEARRELVADAGVAPARPIRAEFLELSRASLLARISEITSRMGGTVQVAHRKLSGLSDDDLRRLLETICTEATES